MRLAADALQHCRGFPRRLDLSPNVEWALALVEEFPVGLEKSVFKVGGKMFAVAALERRQLTMSLKCEPPLAESAPEVGVHAVKRIRPAEPDRRGERVAPALEQFVPAAVRSLEKHFGDGDPAAWRAAIRVLELFYAWGGETIVDVALPADADAVASLGWHDLHVLVRRVSASFLLPRPRS